MFFRETQMRKTKAKGFRDGSQGVSSDNTQKDIQARFEHHQEMIRHASASRIKFIEARIETVKLRKEDTEVHWRKLEEQTNGMPPPIALPFLAITLAAAAVVGEAILLAPVMDGFGIAKSEHQYFTAAVLILASSGLIEVAIQHLNRPYNEESDEKPKASGYRKIGGLITFSLSVFAFAFIAVLGWWRATEMIFASTQQPNSKSAIFLGLNPTLTRICVTLLTIGLPVFAAIASKWGFDSLRLASVWQGARRQFKRFSSQFNKYSRQIEAEREKTQHSITALEKACEQEVNVYLHNHELGRVVGAQQVPLWQIKFKIAAVVLVIVAVCFLIDPALADYIKPMVLRILMYVFATPGLGGLYGYYAFKAWDRPTPEQLYEQQATNWRRTEDNKVADQEIVP
jgi:hypothetical protein